ncbi:MAG: vWA domain-containing protein [Caldilineaceae bacterium]
MKAILSLIVIFAVLFIPGAYIHAQDRSQPGLRIADIDAASFPDIAVYLYGENLDTDLSTLSIVLSEDNLAQTVSSSQSEEVGAQVAFAIDASRNILSGGVSGRTRIDEVRDAVNEFVGLGILSADKDWLSAYATADIPDQYRTIAPWGQDHQAVANALIQDVPAGVLEVTSLFGLIDFTLTQFTNSPAPRRLQRSIVIFSDGADIVSNVEVDDIVRRAEQLDVRLHTVMLGSGARDSRRNLGRLAEVTGGVFVEFSALSAMQPIWQQIAAQRVQQRLTYRLTQEQPRQLAVSATLSDGRPLNHAVDFPVVGARAPELTITIGNDQTQLIRRGAGADTPLAQLEPAVLPITLQATWPDGHERTFRRVDYKVDNETRVQDAEPFLTYAFPIAGLDAGPHTISVTAIDELGLSSSAPPITLQIAVERTGAGQAAGGQPANPAASSTTVSETTPAARGAVGSAAGAAVNVAVANAITNTNATTATDAVSPTGVISAAIPVEAAAAPTAAPTDTPAPAAGGASSSQQAVADNHSQQTTIHNPPVNQ